MKRFFSILLAAMLIAALALTATGCKGNTGDTSSADGSFNGDLPGGVTGVSADALAALSNSKDVRVYSHNESNEEEKKKEADFKEYFDSVYGGNLQFEYTVWEGWESKFITDFAGGAAPDVIDLYSKLWPRAANRGLVYSLQDLEELGVQALDHPTITDTFDIAEKNFTYKGEVYAMNVYNVTPGVMLVNDSLLKDCGIEKTPKQLYNEGQWNWDSFIDIMSKVTAVDKNGDGQADYRGYDGWDATYVMNTNEGYLVKLGEDGKLFANTSDNKVINGLQMYAGMAQNGYMIDRGRFQEGKTATLVETHYNICKTINNKGEGINFDWSVVPMPQGPDNETGSTIGGCDSYAIVSSTQNPQGAFNYIVAKVAYDKIYGEEDPDYDLEYWLDDDGDQMLNDLRSKVKQATWSGVGNIWGSQWEFWGDVRRTQSVSELLSTWTPWLEAQCETENSYATH